MRRSRLVRRLHHAVHVCQHRRRADNGVIRPSPGAANGGGSGWMAGGPWGCVVVPTGTCVRGVLCSRLGTALQWRLVTPSCMGVADPVRCSRLTARHVHGDPGALWTVCPAYCGTCWHGGGSDRGAFNEGHGTAATNQRAGDTLVVRRNQGRRRQREAAVGVCVDKHSGCGANKSSIVAALLLGQRVAQRRNYRNRYVCDHSWLPDAPVKLKSIVMSKSRGFLSLGKHLRTP